jgi:preprotein translocase subunit SecA
MISEHYVPERHRLTECQSASLPVEKNSAPVKLDWHEHFMQGALGAKHPLPTHHTEAILQEVTTIYSLIEERASWDKKDIQKHAEALKNQETLSLTELLSLGSLAAQLFFNIRPYPTQLFTVLALLQPATVSKGAIAQVLTGEGKSLIITLAALALAMQKRRVDIISSSPYLARRDQEKFCNFFACFHITTSHICDEEVPEDRFKAHIVYGTNYHFEFALLRAWLSNTKRAALERGNDSALVDEVDNLFVDIAMNSARVAYPTKQQHGKLWPCLFKILSEAKEPLGSSELKQQVSCTTPHFAKRIAAMSEQKISSLGVSARKAQKAFQQGVDYIIHEQQITIVDKTHTGRLQKRSRWTNGIHPFLECKHRIVPNADDLTPASISHSVFFSRYKHLYGLTGTMDEPCEREEIYTLYGIKSFDVPPYEPNIGKQFETIVCKNNDIHQNTLLQLARSIKAEKRALLLLFPSIAKSLEFTSLLDKEQLSYSLLHDIQKEEEDDIVLKAGQEETITVATNTAGRGTDIIVSQEVLQRGGLHVVLAFYPANKRVEKQAFGRAARQGQPGSYQFVLSLEEESVRSLVGTEKIPSHHLIKHLENARFLKIQSFSKSRTKQAAIDHQCYEALQGFLTRVDAWKQNVSDEWLKTLSKQLSSTENSPSFLTKFVGFQQKRDEFLNIIIETWANTYEQIELSLKEEKNAPPQESKFFIQQLCDCFWKEFLPYMEPAQEGFLRFSHPTSQIPL